jgi:hypothetical protein
MFGYLMIQVLNSAEYQSAKASKLHTSSKRNIAFELFRLFREFDAADQIPRRKNRLSANYSGNEQGDEYGGPGEANLQKLSNVAI